MKKQELLKKLINTKTRSSWNDGVKQYAVVMVYDIELEEIELNGLKELLLNGAESFQEYSYGGCSLIYDCSIAKRLCTPSELKRKKDGLLPPNNRETWLDVQARALFQAYLLIKKTIENN